MATVSLTPETLQYVANLSAFAATKDPYPAVISGVAVTVSKGKVTAFATDRYTLAQYEGDAAEMDELALVVIPAKLLTTAAKGAKNAGNVHLTHNESDNTITFDWGHGSVSDQAVEGNYPAVERLFEGEWGDITGGVVLNPKNLERLSKLTRPSRRVADRLILFEFHGKIDDSGLSTNRPIRATGDGYTVLIQPNLKTR